MYFYCLFFIVYSFLGWVLEVVYAALQEGRFINRGFLLGPACPIYGFGAVGIIAILSPVKNEKPLLFLCALLLASVVELVGGFLLDKIFSQRWWNYSNKPFNIGGYICLKFSILWGIAGVFLVDYMHPFLLRIAEAVPRVAGIVGFSVLYALLLLDIVSAVRQILKLNSDLKRMHGLTQKIRRLSDSLGAQIADYTIKTNERVSAIQGLVRDKAVKGNAEVKKLLGERKAILSNRSRFGNHLLKAFPDWSHRKYKTELEAYKAETEK